jgi:hypothetical protein
LIGFHFQTFPARDFRQPEQPMSGVIENISPIGMPDRIHQQLQRTMVTTDDFRSVFICVYGKD